MGPKYRRECLPKEQQDKQQDSATLIYDLKTMKGTVESYLKYIAQAFKTVHLEA